MPKTPKLPAYVITALGVLVTLGAIVQPSLSSPYKEVVAALLAIATAFGIGYTNSSIANHRQAVVEHVADQITAQMPINTASPLPESVRQQVNPQNGINGWGTPQ